MTSISTEARAPIDRARVMRKLVAALAQWFLPRIIKRRRLASMTELADWDPHRLRDVGMDAYHLAVEARAGADRDPWAVLQRWQ